MSRQFDDALQRLSKVYFVFLADNGITSIDETVSLLEALKSKIWAEGLAATAWAEAPERFGKIKTGNQ